VIWTNESLYSSEPKQWPRGFERLQNRIVLGDDIGIRRIANLDGRVKKLNREHDDDER